MKLIEGLRCRRFDHATGAAGRPAQGAVPHETAASAFGSQTLVFTAAAAVLSCGSPIAEDVLAELRAAMIVERVPPALMASICERCTAGLEPTQVPVDPTLTRDQATLFAAAITLFALRSTPRGDPIGVAAQLCAPYQIAPDAIAAIARRVSSSTLARRSFDAAANLHLLLEPPDLVLQALDPDRDRTPGDRRPRRSAAYTSPQRIQHPADREASEALCEVAGLDDLVEFVMKHAIEQTERITNLGSKLRVGPRQLPELHELFRGCVARAGVHPEPELYLESGGINACTFGADRPYIVLQTGAVIELSASELEFVLGHELGHIRFRHVLHHTAARILPHFAAQLPLGSVIATGLNMGLADWESKAELSADRMGMLVCGDPDAAIRVMMKLSGAPAALERSLDVEAFLDQYEDLRAIAGGLAGIFPTGGSTAGQVHPPTVVRAHELRRWMLSGDHERALAGGAAPVTGPTALPPLQDTTLPFECPICGSVVPAEATRCGTCGSPCIERDRFRRCARCGVSGKPSLRYCESCGARQIDRPEVTR